MVQSFSRLMGRKLGIWIWKNPKYPFLPIFNIDNLFLLNTYILTIKIFSPLDVNNVFGLCIRNLFFHKLKYKPSKILILASTFIWMFYFGHFSKMDPKEFILRHILFRIVGYFEFRIELSLLHMTKMFSWLEINFFFVSLTKIMHRAMKIANLRFSR